MKREFAVDTAGLAAAQEFLGEICDSPRAQVILDEIVSNIVRCSGATAFSVEGSADAEDVRLVFSDDGVPFDPLSEAQEPNVGPELTERSIGGLGIFMVKKLSKSIAYERRDGRNVLTVVVAAR